MQTAVAVGAAGVLVTGVATGRVHPHTVAVGLGVVGAAAAAWLAIVKATLERLHASVRACGEDVQPTDRTACVMHLPSINTRCMFLFLLTTYMNVCVCVCVCVCVMSQHRCCLSLCRIADVLIYRP